MTEAVVDVWDATKRFGAQAAVSNLDLHVETGKILGLIGPSGSGKTTTIRMLTGVTAPTSGRVEVFGVPPISFRAKHRARLGYMPQLSVLFPHLSLQENLRFVASIYGLPPWQRGPIREALEFVDLTDDRRKLHRDTSGGMQRRLALAATLMHDPDLLFLDEPTAGIDPVLRRRFWERFEELRDSGKTLLVTTQYVGEAAYCDAVAVMNEGRLLVVDTPEGLRRRALGGDVVDVTLAVPVPPQLPRELAALPSVHRVTPIEQDPNSLRVVVDADEVAVVELQRWLAGAGLEVTSVQAHLPSYDDVFVALVEEARSAA